MTLSGLRLIVTDGGGRREHELTGEGEYPEVLREHFGIVLPG